MRTEWAEGVWGGVEVCARLAVRTAKERWKTKGAKMGGGVMEWEFELERESELECESERARYCGCGLGVWLWLLAGLGGGIRTAGRLPRHPAGRCAAGWECAGGLWWGVRRAWGRPGQTRRTTRVSGLGRGNT